MGTTRGAEATPFLRVVKGDPTPEELADLELFLQEREEMRRKSLESQRERVAGLSE